MNVDEEKIHLKEEVKGCEAIRNKSSGIKLWNKEIRNSIKKEKNVDVSFRIG